MNNERGNLLTDIEHCLTALAVSVSISALFMGSCMVLL